MYIRIKKKWEVQPKITKKNKSKKPHTEYEGDVVTFKEQVKDRIIMEQGSIKGDPKNILAQNIHAARVLTQLQKAEWIDYLDTHDFTYIGTF